MRISKDNKTRYSGVVNIDQSGFTLYGWCAKWRWIREHGIKAYLTWATFDEGVGKLPLRRSARFWRWVFERSYTWAYRAIVDGSGRCHRWMGVAWFDHTRLKAHTIVMPFNYVIGWLYRVWVHLLNPWAIKEWAIVDRRHALSVHFVNVTREYLPSAMWESLMAKAQGRHEAKHVPLENPYLDDEYKARLAKLDSAMYRRELEGSWLAMGDQYGCDLSKSLKNAREKVDESREPKYDANGLRLGAGGTPLLMGNCYVCGREIVPLKGTSFIADAGGNSHGACAPPSASLEVMPGHTLSYHPHELRTICSCGASIHDREAGRSDYTNACVGMMEAKKRIDDHKTKLDHEREQRATSGTICAKCSGLIGRYAMSVSEGGQKYHAQCWDSTLEKINPNTKNI